MARGTAGGGEGRGLRCGWGDVTGMDTFDFFISYCAQDRAWCLWVEAFLKAQGQSVRVLLRDDEEAGRDWIAEIEEGIKGARAVLALVSPGYEQSYWCQQERQLALRRQAEVRAATGGAEFVLPLRIDAAVQMSDLLGNQSWIDLAGRPEAEVVRKLTNLLTRLGVRTAGRRGGEALPAFPGPRLDRHDVRERRRTTLLCRLEHKVESGLSQLATGNRALSLPLAIDHGATSGGFERRLRAADRRERLPEGTRLIDEVRGSPGGVLVLGAPGAGKTVELFLVMQELLATAYTTPGAPVPVLFDLAPWEPGPGDLGDWLADQLGHRYGVSAPVATEMIEGGEITALLDGLDEVSPDAREDCVRAINAFVRESDVQTVVTARIEEYGHLDEQLGLERAVELLPLETAQVLGAAREEEHAEVAEALDGDEDLQRFARNPLMLRVLLLAAPGLERSDLHDTPAERLRARLFDEFLNVMFERRGVAPAERQRLRRAIGWLARGMLAHDPSACYVEHLQGSWLGAAARRRYLLTERLLIFAYDLVSAGLVGGVVTGYVSGYGVNLRGFLLVGGLVAFLFCLPRLGPIRPVERLRWSGVSSRGVLLRAAVLAAACAAVVFLIMQPLRGEADARTLGTLVGASLFVVSLMMFGHVSRELEERLRVNEGIHRSFTNFLVVTAVATLAVGSVAVWAGGAINERFSAHAWSWWAARDLLPEQLLLSFGLALLIGRWFGALPVLRHASLRVALCAEQLPLRLRPLLDRLADLIVLRRSLGAYAFQHRYLLEHFAGADGSERPGRAAEGSPPPAWRWRLGVAALLVVGALAWVPRLADQMEARYRSSAAHNAPMGSPEERESVELARRLDPSYVNPVLQQSWTELYTGDLDRAGDLARQAVAMDPTLASAWATLASVEFASGRDALAFEHWDRAEALDPMRLTVDRTEALWMAGAKEAALASIDDTLPDLNGDARREVFKWLHEPELVLHACSLLGELDVDQLVASSGARLMLGDVDGALRDGLLAFERGARDADLLRRLILGAHAVHGGERARELLMIGEGWPDPNDDLLWQEVRLLLCSGRIEEAEELIASTPRQVPHYAPVFRVFRGEDDVSLLGLPALDALVALAVPGASPGSGRTPPLAYTPQELRLRRWRDPRSWWYWELMDGVLPALASGTVVDPRWIDELVAAGHWGRLGHAVRALNRTRSGRFSPALEDLIEGERAPPSYLVDDVVELLRHVPPAVFDWTSVVERMGAACDASPDDPGPRLERAALALIFKDFDLAARDRAMAQALLGD